MEKILFTQWLEKSILCHKREVNPDHPSLFIIDNHSSRFSPETVKISEENELEIFFYPGHLTHSARSGRGFKQTTQYCCGHNAPQQNSSQWK